MGTEAGLATGSREGRPDRPVAGVGVAVIDDLQVVVVQKRNGPFAGLWALPGGKIELGETRPMAAMREVKEETGLDVEIGEVIWIGEAIGPGSPPQWHFTLVDYVAQVTGGELVAGDDASDARWVTLDELLALPIFPLMSEIVPILRSRL